MSFLSDGTLGACSPSLIAVFHSRHAGLIVECFIWHHESMNQRGLSGAVQTALLLPLAIGLLLATLQWGMVAWANATAVAAVDRTLHAAAARGGDLVRAREAGSEVAKGALSDVSVKVWRSGAVIEASVTGTANFVMLPVTVTHRGERPVEESR